MKVESLNVKANQVLRRLQQELVQQSPQGQFIIAEGSGHMIHIEQPEVVINAIKSVIKESEN